MKSIFPIREGAEFLPANDCHTLLWQCAVMSYLMHDGHTATVAFL